MGKAKKIVLVCCIVLVLIVFMEFLCIQLELFDELPYAGIVFHLVGGMAVGVGIYHLFQSYLAALPWYIKGCFIIGAVSFAAIGWEGFEWAFTHFYYHNNLQGSLDNTMGDLYVGVSGGCLAAGWIVVSRQWSVNSGQ